MNENNGANYPTIEPEEMPKFLNDVASEFFADNMEIREKLAQCSVFIQFIVAMRK